MDNCPQRPLEANAGRVPADRADDADRPRRFGQSLCSSWRRRPSNSLHHSGERDASVQLTNDRLDAHRNAAPRDAGTDGVLSGDHASRTLNHRGTEPQGSERGYPGSGFLAASEALLGALLAEPVQGGGVDPGHLGGPGIGHLAASRSPAPPGIAHLVEPAERIWDPPKRGERPVESLAYTGSEVIIGADPSTISVGIDGEAVTMNNPVHRAIRPRALRVLPPRTRVPPQPRIDGND